MQLDFTFGLNTGHPFSPFYYLHTKSSGHLDAVAMRIAVSQMILWIHKGIFKQCRETKSVYAMVCVYVIRLSAHSHCT